MNGTKSNLMSSLDKGPFLQGPGAGSPAGSPEAGSPGSQG